MKQLAIALLLAFAATIAPAQETAKPATEKPADSALVKASKASTRKKKKPTRAITNADLRKPSNAQGAKSKAAPTPATVVEVKADPEAEPLNDDERLKRRHADEEKVAAADKRVAELERELARVEQDYYEENDPTYRDSKLAKRFEQTKKQLAAARAELTDLRDTASKHNQP